MNEWIKLIIEIIATVGGLFLAGWLFCHIINYNVSTKHEARFGREILNADFAIAYGKYRELQEKYSKLTDLMWDLELKIDKMNKQRRFIPSCELDKYITTLDLIKTQYLAIKTEREVCAAIKNQTKEKVDKLFQKYLGITLDKWEQM